MDNLLFRRQFLAGPRPIRSFKGWKNIKIKDDFHLTIHPDLNVEYYTSEFNTIILLGFIIDPYQITFSNLDIIKEISETSMNFKSVIDNTYHLSGRWIIIYISGDKKYIFNDPVGFRELYFSIKSEEIWIGTDPSILNTVLNLNQSNDNNICHYINSKYFNGKENAWYGDKTIYEKTFHLLPNHSLNLKTGEAFRYWVDKENTLSLDEAAKEASNIIKNSLSIANNRYDLMLGITAGLDSRVLLAGTKEFSKEVFYFISTMNLNKDHMDIKIPTKLLPKLGLKLNILKDMPPLRDDFKDVLRKNILLHRKNHPRNISTQYYLDNLNNKLYINGVASEIVRNFYGTDHPQYSEINTEYLMNLIEVPQKYSFIYTELEAWLCEVQQFSEPITIDLISLFYWEQRMGNWGSLTVNEEDVAIEGFMPFNNRKLLMILTSVEKEYREYPKYELFYKIIEYLWPEALSEPINPESSITKIKKIIKNVVPNKILNILRYMK